jgi:DNA polymerase V
MKKTFGVAVERTIRELNGTPCISIDELPAKQQIICSRSFGERITQLQDMKQALCQYAERAAKKIRHARQYCRHISVFMRFSPYSNEPQYGNYATQTLIVATQGTRDIVAAVMKALDQTWRDGYRYVSKGWHRSE